MAFFRLSYTLTRDFSLKNTVFGIIMLLTSCCAVGLINLCVKGRITSCTQVYSSKYDPEQCQASMIHIGEALCQPQLTYVAASQFNYSGQKLFCRIHNRGLTLNLISRVAPQFIWGYKICCRDNNCLTCGSLNLTIQSFSVVSACGNVNTTIRKGPVEKIITEVLDGNDSSCSDKSFDPVMVLRYGDANSGSSTDGSVTFEAFSRTQSCPKPLESLSSSLQNVRESVDGAIAQDLGFHSFIVPRTYMCNQCRKQWDSPTKILLQVVTGIGSLATIIYQVIIYLLEKCSSLGVKRIAVYDEGLASSSISISSS